MGRVGVHIYDRQRCSWMLNCVVPYYNYSKSFRDLVRNFIDSHVREKRKTVKSLIGENGRGTNV